MEVPRCVQDRVPIWDQRAKVSHESFAPPKPCFAPVQPLFAPSSRGRCSLGRKDLWHPFMTSFGSFRFSGPLPARVPDPWGCNPCADCLFSCVCFPSLPRILSSAKRHTFAFSVVSLFFPTKACDVACEPEGFFPEITKSLNLKATQ